MSLTDVISTLLGRKPSASKRVVGASTHHWITNPYHAVAIMPGAGACSAAKRLAKQRFFSREAPPLPIAGCDASHCTCHYKHYDDRRAEPRRQSDTIGLPRVWNGAERRGTPGRRRNDGMPSSPRLQRGPKS
jgi:hypothetical protein